ncbi:hypothetical protein LX99_03795 [Mucilaginibacter oryzae]|uniref:Uncharacterized protein n=2 Tax=Mucilaginibacter oryzae TaxID=468058 RepID=A0A316HK46_9SPHI|nr:hypothetical protein LX99_03795 [Mucilaginibacter oryzae]
MESTRIVLNGNTSGGHTPTDPYNPTNPTGPTNPNDPNPGFPPPDDPGPTVSPCYVVNTITNNVQNPCLKNMVDSTMVSGISNQINSLIKDVFGGTEKLNLTFVDNVTLASGVEGHTEMNGGFDDFGNLNIQIQLNKDELPGYSQQYIATVIMHEALHAYLEAKGVDPKNQHENIIIDYVNKMSASLKIMFPGLTLSDAKNLSLGGLDQTTTFLYTVARDMKLSGDFAATQSAYSIGSLGKRCK